MRTHQSWTPETSQREHDADDSENDEAPGNRHDRAGHTAHINAGTAVSADSTRITLRPTAAAARPRQAITTSTMLNKPSTDPIMAMIIGGCCPSVYSGAVRSSTESTPSSTSPLR